MYIRTICFGIGFTKNFLGGFSIKLGGKIKKFNLQLQKKKVIVEIEIFDFLN